MGVGLQLMSESTAGLRSKVLEAVVSFYQAAHSDREFVRGKTRVQYAGRVYDEQEMVGMVDAVLDFWLTAGPRTQVFERVLAEFIGTREVIPVNSGSSANLVAVTTLCSKQLRGRRLEPGDEVIVPATSFSNNSGAHCSKPAAAGIGGLLRGRLQH
ncbi:lipopolysaccharide biosynthesis protein RfbH [Chloroflexota bacterium]|nr:lipopolysaccharide biosynthesis protein RfbH [Chloroflexota bacterium]